MDKLESGLTPKLDMDPVGIMISYAVWILPIISLEFLWLQFFAPLPVFYFLTKSGNRRGGNTLSAAILLAGITATAIGATAAFFFTAAMLPAGYVMVRAATAKSTPLMSGFQAFIILLAGSIAWNGAYSVIYHVSLYEEILKSLDQALLTAGGAFMEGKDLPAEQALVFEAAISRLRELLPRILPGFLLSTMETVVFFNMVLGQWLLKRKALALAPWPPFVEWRLPEQLVVTVIFSGICLLIPVVFLNGIGLNLLVLVGTLYLIQGIAVLTSLLDKWKVPLFLRFLIFLLVVMQAYGIIILAGLGLADVWADFRRTMTADHSGQDKG